MIIQIENISDKKAIKKSSGEACHGNLLRLGGISLSQGQFKGQLRSKN